MLTLQPGSVIAARYRLDRELARGGMGSVWVGHHLQLDVPIAVKFMDAGVAVSPDLRVRFEREAKAAAKLRSPHIIQVHDYGIEDGTPYIVMELLEGEDLNTRLRRVGRLSLPAAAAVATQIAKALRSAHEAGLVHRDLKPANVFLSRHQDEEIVKVLDFGIAKATGEAQVGEGTATGLVLGSAHYMSPEQTRAARELDGRSDLWSLGVILYRSLTGRLPFPGSQASAVFVAICADPFPLPSSVAPDLDPDVDAFFVRALKRDPAERFQTARELAEAFTTLAGGAVSTSGRYSQPFAPPVDAVSSPTAQSGGTFTSAQRSLPAAPPRRSALLPVAGGALVLAAIGGAALFLRGSASPPATAASAERSGAPPAAAAPPPVSLPAATPPAAPVVVTPSAGTATPAATASATPAPSASAPPSPSPARAPQAKAPAAPAAPSKPPSGKDPLFGF